MGAALCQSVAGEEHSLLRGVARAAAPLPAAGVQPRCPTVAVAPELGSQGSGCCHHSLWVSLPPLLHQNIPGLWCHPCVGAGGEGCLQCWWSCSLPGLPWLGQLLDSHSPSQKAGGVGRAGPAPGPRQSPGAVRMCHWGIQPHSPAHRQFLIPAELR